MKICSYPLVICCLLLLAGCAKRETPVDIGNREQILHLGNLSEPRDLDPHVVTGVSAFISPRGKVEQILGVGEEGILEASLAGRQELTFYSRFSWLVPLACWLLLAFAILRPAFGAGDEARDRVRGRES